MIVNEYLDDELMSRNGFFLEELKVNKDTIYLYRDGMFLYMLDIPENASLKKDGAFPNFYVVEADQKRMEIYFP
jgi:hypothetical protein